MARFLAVAPATATKCRSKLMQETVDYAGCALVFLNYVAPGLGLTASSVEGFTLEV